MNYELQATLRDVKLAIEQEDWDLAAYHATRLQDAIEDRCAEIEEATA